MAHLHLGAEGYSTDGVNGKVGVGTNAPGDSLEVQPISGTNTGLTIKATSGLPDTGGATLTIDTTAQTNGRKWQFISNDDQNAGGAGALSIYDATAGSNRLTIDTAGKAGLGTVSPATQLHIDAPSANTASQFGVGRLMARSIGDMADGFGGSLQLGIRDTAGVDNLIGYINWYRANAQDNSGSMAFYTVAGGTYAERLTIRYDGKVGIGTTSPGELLHVSGGDVLLDNDKKIKMKNTSGSALRILDLDSGNNLNIGRDDSIASTQLFGDVEFYDDAASPTQMIKFNPTGTLFSIKGAAKLLELTMTSGEEADPMAEAYDSTTQTSATKKVELARNGSLKLGHLDYTAPGFHWQASTEKLKVKSILMEHQGDTCELALRRSEGTPPTGSRATLHGGDVTGRIYWVPWDGTDFPIVSSGKNGEIAEIYASCDGDPSQTSRPGKLHFRTTPSGAVVAEDRLLIDRDGNIGIGTQLSPGNGSRVVFLQNASQVPDANPSNGGVLFADGGALKWRSQGGLVTVLAPNT